MKKINLTLTAMQTQELLACIAARQEQLKALAKGGRWLQSELAAALADLQEIRDLIHSASVI